VSPLRRIAERKVTEGGGPLEPQDDRTSKPKLKLNALQQEAVDRYERALDMADDLWQREDLTELERAALNAVGDAHNFYFDRGKLFRAFGIKSPEDDYQRAATMVDTVLLVESIEHSRKDGRPMSDAFLRLLIARHTPAARNGE
jgi:hypothetical protein